MSQDWHPGIFDGGHTLSPESQSANLGSKLHVWCDEPDAVTEQQIAADIAAPLRDLAHLAWSGCR
ncbi:MAG: hypothetical protein JOZ47_16480 [Kutzneria sp.]|nr:hypothetical protein [Kutzneria sp.]MBV9846644.1 hypothetical protein [Kutzneria sp.]